MRSEKESSEIFRIISLYTKSLSLEDMPPYLYMVKFARET